MYDGVATLAGKTRRRFAKQPTRKKKPKTKTKTADDKCVKKADDKNAKKAEDKDTATAKDKKADKAESEDEWDSIEGPNELGELWQQYLAGKFSATKLERARAEFEDLGENKLSEEDQLTIQEYVDAVHHMKNDKAVGPDGVRGPCRGLQALADS